MTTATADIDSTSEQDGEMDTNPTVSSYDDINVPVIVMVGFISTIVTICTIFFVQGLCYKWQNSYILERSFDYVNEPVRSIVEGQKSMLSGEKEGVASIEDSMKQVIDKYGK